MEEVEVPKVLKQFAQSLISKQRPYIAVKATPLDSELDKDPLDVKQSKFLGKPFIPVGIEYPKDKNGEPLVLIAQINFSELPQLEGFPDEGILQLYFSSTEWWGMSEGERILYISGDDLKKDHNKNLPPINQKLYEDLPIWKIHKLRFEKAIDTGNSEDCHFLFDFGGKDYWEFEEGLTEDDKKSFSDYFTSCGHKIGGYAYFTQGDPRDYSKNQRDDIQLLQIDIDDEIMFGDSGIGHIFISPENFANRAFEKAYFYWDCC